jgi:hypothetical protein
MAGYTRQSIAHIINGSEVTAPPLNAEFNQMAAAFQAASGHSHDGSTGNAPKINLTTSVSGYLPAVHGGIGGKNNLSATSNPTTTNDSGEGYAPGSMWENTTTGRVYICVGNTANAAVWRELVQVQTGDKITPEVHGLVDLGGPQERFQDLFLSGGISSFGNTAIGGTLNVLGNSFVSNISASGDLSVTGSISANGDLSVTGDTTVGSHTADDLVVLNGTTLQTLTTNGTLTSAGNTFLNGPVTLIGNSTSDSIGFISRVATDFVPSPSGASKNLGLPEATWHNMYLSGTAHSASISVAGDSLLQGDVIMLGDFNKVSSTGPITSDIGVSSPNIVTANLSATGGTINGTPIGGAIPSTVVGTIVEATTGFTGDLEGNVVGNITGNVTGNVTGSLSGNVSANSGTSTFTDVTINGTLNLNAATTGTITNLSAPVNANDAARKVDIDNAVAGLLDGAPDALNTLNELASALNDDANLYATLNARIAERVRKSGDTMTGPLDMGSSYVQSNFVPTVNSHLANKQYVDSTTLSSSGGTVSGSIDVGSNFVRSTFQPTQNDHLTNKSYVDGILGSATVASESASTASIAASNASLSEANSANSASAAAVSATSAAQSLDTFGDIFLGIKTSEPTVDNDGDALQDGAIYFNSTDDVLYIYHTNVWRAFDNTNQQVISNYTYTNSSNSKSSFYGLDDNGATPSINTNSCIVYLNGIKLVPNVDYTAYSEGVTLTAAALYDDVIEIVTYKKFSEVHQQFKQLSDVSLFSPTSGSQAYIHALGVDSNGDIVSQGHNTSNAVLLSAGSGVRLGLSWFFHEVGGHLQISYNNTTLMKLSPDGDVEFAGNVTSNATI